MNEERKNTSLLSYDEIDWEEVDRITEIERNLPDVMEFDKEYREKTWKKYLPKDESKFSTLRFWWGLEVSRLNNFYDLPENDRTKLDVTLYPSAETCAVALVRCLVLLEEAQYTVRRQWQLYQERFFDTDYGNRGEDWGLEPEYWQGLGPVNTYPGYFALRYAPHVIYGTEDHNLFRESEQLFFYHPEFIDVMDRRQLFECLKPMRDAERYILNTHYGYNR